jgi:hypothetical protein
MEVAHCFRCGWKANRFQLARELGLVKSPRRALQLPGGGCGKECGSSNQPRKPDRLATKQLLAKRQLLATKQVILSFRATRGISLLLKLRKTVIPRRAARPGMTKIQI